MGRRNQTNLEILLGEWGRLKQREQDGGGGYPRAAAFSRMRVDGDRTGCECEMLIDDDLVRVDTAIMDLCPAFKMAIKAAYVWSGGTKYKIERLRVSERTFFADLRAAKMQLAHVMEGRYAEQEEYA